MIAWFESVFWGMCVCDIVVLWWGLFLSCFSFFYHCLVKEKEGNMNALLFKE